MNSLAKRITLSTGLGLLLLTTGCFDTKEDFTINPDGSGKVVHECTFQAVNLNMGNENEDPGKALTNAVREVLEKATGIDAWRNVTFKTQDDGRLYFRGTAYFKNLSQLNIPNQTMLEFNWQRMADGTTQLTLSTNKNDKSEGLSIKKKAKPAKNLSPVEAAKKIKQDRIQFQQAKPMLAGFLGNMKHAVVFHLPGKVSQSSNFTKDDAGNLAITFDGAKMVAVMDKLVNDDAWCQKHGGTGFDDVKEKPAMEDEVNQLIYGEKAPVSATITGALKPLFDYAAEVAVAKQEYAQTQKNLKVGATRNRANDEDNEVVVTAAPATGGVKSVKVVGVRLVMGADQKRDLRPLNYFKDEYSLALLVEFPGAVQSVTDKTALNVAMADDGTSLLPDSEWDRKVHFPNLAKDKTATILEFKMNLPGSGVKGLKELSGTVQYRVAGGTKEMDLGLGELTAGATGTNLDARIESIKDGWQKNGSQQMTLRLKTNPDGLKSLTLVVAGNKTELRQNGYGGGGDAYSFTYECKTNFPVNGRLVAEVYDKIQTYEAPFKLENISLLGASLNAGK